MFALKCFPFIAIRGLSSRVPKYIVLITVVKLFLDFFGWGSLEVEALPRNVPKRINGRNSSVEKEQLYNYIIVN